MYLYHYELIPLLPNEMLIMQWKDCYNILNYWEKDGNLAKKYEYIRNHDRRLYYYYVRRITDEMNSRNIRVNLQILKRINDFCNTQNNRWIKENYPEQDQYHLRECLYMLEERARLGYMDKEFWNAIYNKYKDFTPLWYYDKNTNYNSKGEK